MFKSCMTAKSKKQIKIDHLYKKKKNRNTKITYTPGGEEQLRF